MVKPRGVVNIEIKSNNNFTVRTTLEDFKYVIGKSQSQK